MKKLIGNKIGNVINLMIEGNAFQKTFETQEQANEFFKLMQRAREDESAYEQLLFELNRRYKSIIKGVLEKDSEDKYYLKGIDVPMPELLADTFVDYLENDFPITALSNFWKLLVTNPDIRVREDLFKFLQTYNFAITDNGYFIAYKAVEVASGAEVDIAAFVSNQYLKVKKWKKNPAHFEVVMLTTETEEEIENPDYEYYGDSDDDNDDFGMMEVDNGEPQYITETKRTVELKLVDVNRGLNKHLGDLAKGIDANTKFEIVGNLADLFKNIDQLVDNRTVYQSKHSGKNGKIKQVLGEPVKQERSTTDADPKVECSSGLHVGSTRYVQTFGSSSNDKILLVLVNPAHVVAVPEYDNSKMRTCEYFPYAELERNPDGTFEVVDSSYFEDDYMRYELADLEKEISRIQAEIDGVHDTEKLNYKQILEARRVTIEEALKK